MKLVSKLTVLFFKNLTGSTCLFNDRKTFPRGVVTRLIATGRKLLALSNSCVADSYGKLGALIATIDRHCSSSTYVCKARRMFDVSDR